MPGWYQVPLSGTWYQPGYDIHENEVLMRVIVQRVKKAEVRVDARVVGKIGSGLLVFLGVAKQDNKEDADYLAEKIVNLRVFRDESDKMNKSCLDIKGEVLVVSQFTLLADCRKGRRPSYSESAEPESANNLYEYFIEVLKKYNLKIEKGIFAAFMEVELTNDGPVTLLLDSKKKF